MTTEFVSCDAPAPKRFRFIAGNLSLDFCNSVGGKREAIPHENLHSYAHFLSWCEQAGLMSAAEVHRLGQQGASHPDESSAVLNRALGLREAIYRIFFALAQDRDPSTRDIDMLNSELAMGLGRLRLASNMGAGGFSWHWADAPTQLDHALGPIAYSAAGLLASKHDLRHIRQCKADNCGWLFLDSSKNHSRCWCDMSDCGNRAKVRRHRQKQRDSDQQNKNP